MVNVFYHRFKIFITHAPHHQILQSSPPFTTTLPECGLTIRSPKMTSILLGLTTPTPWDAWSDSDIRDWLIQHNYLRTDAQVKCDDN
jgi:hypothetical protein